MRRLALDDERVRGIRLSRNYGQHNALLCGIRAARYDIIVTMDDDLQHPVSEIPLLLEALAAGHEVACRTSNEAAATACGAISLPSHQARAAKRDGREIGRSGQRVPRHSRRSCARLP